MAKKASLLIALFVLPGLVIFFLASGEHVFRKLPYYGPKEVVETVVNGETVSDTAYFQVPSFRFTDEQGQVFTEDSLIGKNYVVNFFFTRCPTICPTMSMQLRRVIESTKEINNLLILSHSIDPKNDTVESLQAYAEKYFATPDKWKFLRAEMEYTHDFARDGYLLNAMADDNAPGGFLHSEYVMLIDKERHIRGVYKGTSNEDIDRLIDEVRLLMKEQLIEQRAREHAAEG